MISLSQSATAVCPTLTASFLGAGGAPPYSYTVREGGAGGTINSSTGLYTAPISVSVDPTLVFDTIQVRDSLGATAIAQIMVGTPLMLFCEIIQREMNLPVGRVYLWDQKIFQPTDSDVYVAVSVLTCKPFGNTNSQDGGGSGLNSVQSVNMYARLDLDIISRDISAVNRKEEVILALNSNYAQSQQEANSFFIGQLPPGAQFLNLSNQDGSAIPYRFKIAIAMQYFVKKVTAVPYYDSFTAPPLTIEP